MTEPRLRGRDEPLRVLRAALAAALAGRGQIALIAGEPGIGKSALAAVIAAEAEAAGAAVTSGRAWEFADGPPYFPVWPCLGSLGVELADHPSDDGHGFALWEAVLASLARAVAGGTVVWIVEDVHAADLGTLDLLAFLAQPVRGMRVLVVATMRSVDPRLSDRKLQRLARIGRDGVDLHLAPLSADDIAAVTADTLGRAVAAGSLRKLVELTGGNPLFVVECARAAREAGGFEGTLGGLPPTVRQVVLDRVAQLPGSTREALATGAVLGRDFSAASIARMHDSLPARVIDALLPALRSGVLREISPGRFVFSHTLVRDAIEDALGHDERASLHGRAERALSALGDTVEILVERARHALAAAWSSDPAQTLALARRATELLEREAAFDRAFELHARVDEARIAGYLPAASPADKLHVARIAREAGRSDVMRQLCEEVVATARQHDDAELLAQAALLHATEVRVGVFDPLQVALLEEARRQLGDRAPGLACRVLARLATALQPTEDVSIPNQLAREALHRAHALGDERVILDVLDHGGLGGYGAPVVERLAWAEELRDRAMRAGDVSRAITAWTWLAYWRAETGDFDGFSLAISSALALSDETRHPRERWGPLLLASGNAIAHGRFAESDRHVTEAQQIAALIDDSGIGLALVAHVVMRAKLRGNRAELEAALPQLDGVLSGIKHGDLTDAFMRASCAARLGDVVGTAAQLALIGGHGPAFDNDLELVAFLGEACALAGDDDERRRVRAVLARSPDAELFGAGVSYVYEGSVRRLLGLLDASLGELAAAEAHLRVALARARERRHTPWIAQIACELAGVLHRAGRDAEARALSAEQIAIARELDMPGLMASSSTVAGAPFLLARIGEVWTVERGSTAVRVKDSRGVQLLARLVERPGEDIHVLALASDDGTSAPESHAGEMIDESARKAYRRRLTAIDDELVAAERAGHQAATRRLEREQQLLVDELARAVGLGGRARRAGSATERARVNVQRRLKDAIARIAEVDGDLGQYLERAVRTGTFCCFRP